MKLLKDLKKSFRQYKYNRKVRLQTEKCSVLVKQLSLALQKCRDKIPVLVVSYNNGVYVKNITLQLNQYNITPIIIDNNSTSSSSINILNELENDQKAFIARSDYNFGHMVGFIPSVYELLPDVFAYTDPDLQFNENLPPDFLNTLASITTKIPVFKAGFALSLDNHGTLIDTKIHHIKYKPMYYDKTVNLRENEAKHWMFRLQHEQLELYAALIDTTFAVYRKQNFAGEFHSGVRVAGNFTCIHLPWFKELELFSEKELKTYKHKNVSTSSY